jgi:hypothetical protein
MPQKRHNRSFRIRWFRCCAIKPNCRMNDKIRKPEPG